MKTVTNKTNRPIKVRLPGDKVLFLGALKQAPLRDDALAHPPVQKLIEAGTIEILEPTGVKRDPGGSTGGVTGQASRGHVSRAAMKTGDR